MEYDINEVLDHAKSLDIKITNAEIGTEICQCWIDRVMDAAMAFRAGRIERCQELIDDANRYAI